MSKAKLIIINESLKELVQFKKSCSNTKTKRLLMLIELKKEKGNAISKRDLAKRIGVDPNSITTWKRLYEQNGIEGIMSDGRIGFKSSLVSVEEHKKMEQKLKDPKNGIRGYVEFLEWVKTELLKDMKYITLVKYAERHFGSKIKVARKSHVKKDAEAVETFKKSLVRNAKK